MPKSRKPDDPAVLAEVARRLHEQEGVPLAVRAAWALRLGTRTTVKPRPSEVARYLRRLLGSSSPWLPIPKYVIHRLLRGGR